MERGEGRIALIVLILIGIVGVIASVTLFLRGPTGLVMQGQDIYPTEDARNIGITCENPGQKAVFLGYSSNFQVYCCLEDMIGQNECIFPYRVLR